MVKEDFVRGGGVPLPCSMGGLPGGVASMSFAWTGMASETYTHSREVLKKKKEHRGSHVIHGQLQRGVLQSAG